jgi:hypothetical protein
VQGRPQADDPYDVAAPRYTPELLKTAWSVVLGGVAFLALFATELDWLWRGVGAGAAVGAGVLAVNGWFGVRWLSCQWRRARLHPRLLNAKRRVERELAAFYGMLILAAGLPPLDVEGLYEQDGRIVLVVAGQQEAAMQRGDTLLVLDTLEGKLMGRARVVAVPPSRCEAEVHEQLDALFWGFVREEIRHYRRQLPPDAVVFRELDEPGRHELFVRLMQEVEK